jgi:hypothetical protein
VFRDFSSGKRGFILKHPNHPVSCVKEFSALEVAVFGDFRTAKEAMLSTVYRDFSSGKRGCVLKHNNYPVNCVQEFQLWKAWLYSETL